MKKTTLLTALGISLSMIGVCTGAAAPRTGSAAAATTPPAGTIVTYAGGGVGDSRPATSAYLSDPEGIAVDAAGSLYIADAGEHRVRVVHHGIMTTLAGTGDSGNTGDGGLATAARLEAPIGIAVDGVGNVYVSDAGTGTGSSGMPAGGVRRIDRHGVISTLASNLDGPGGLAASSDGRTVYVAETGGSRVLAIPTGGGGPATVAGIGVAGGPAVAGYTGDDLPASKSTLDNPRAVALDDAGNLYITDTKNALLRRVSLTADTITTVLGSPSRPANADAGGLQMPGDGSLHWPVSVTVDSRGLIYVGDYDPAAVQASTGDVYRVLVVRPGNAGRSSWVVNTTGAVSLAGGLEGDVYGAQPPGLCGGTGSTPQQASGEGCVVEVRTNELVAGQRGTIRETIGDAALDGQPATSAYLSGLTGVNVDPKGEIYFTDATDAVHVDAAGVTRTVAGDGTWQPWRCCAIPGRLDDPDGVRAHDFPLQPTSAVSDGRGGVYISDVYTHRVVRVDPRGVLHDVAGNGDSTGTVDPAISDPGDGRQAVSVPLDTAWGLLLGPDGSLYFTEPAQGVVRRVDGRGIITTVAGSVSCTGTGDIHNGEPAVQACLSGPTDLAMDASGNLYIAEGVGDRVSKVSPGGAITAVAGVFGNDTLGSTAPTYCGDGGPATSACLNDPQGVAVDAAGNVFIADTGNAVVRKVDAGGTITTVVGVALNALRANATLGYELNLGVPPDRGDGGPATGAYLQRPVAVAVDAHGNLYIADAGDGRIREVGGLAASAGAHLDPAAAAHPARGGPRLNRLQ